MTIYDLENNIIDLSSGVDHLKGKLSLLEDQFAESQEKIDDLKNEKSLNAKSIEVLTLVQESTKTLITNMFEGIVTNALQFIHQSDEYKFELEFGRRGNIPELNFNIMTPDMKESHDILNTRGGGTADIVSLALRLVLLEISKTDGFVFLDEPARHLDNPDTFEKLIEFIKEIQNNTKRQFILITHKQEIVNGFDNAITIK